MRTFQLNGTILNSDISGVSVGDSYVATLSYDDAQAPASSNFNFARYDNYTYELTVSGMTFVKQPTDQIAVFDQDNTDAFIIDGYDPSLGLFLGNSDGNLYSSTALPSTLILADFAVAEVVWDTGANRFRGNVTSITDLTAPALDPAVAIDELIAAVEACVANGELKASHGQALTNKLESALKKLDKDDTVAVVEKLQGFIDQVTSLEADGQISADKANALIADAQAILNAVQSPGKSSPTALRPTAQETTWSTIKSAYR